MTNDRNLTERLGPPYMDVAGTHVLIFSVVHRA